jgi:hypothetical protein
MRSHAPLRFVFGSAVVRFALAVALSLAASGCLETTAQTGEDDKTGIKEVPSPSGGQSSTGSSTGEGGGEEGQRWWWRSRGTGGAGGSGGSGGSGGQGGG